MNLDKTILKEFKFNNTQLKNKKIVIYGFNLVSMLIATMLVVNKIKVEGFIDLKIKKTNKKFLNIKFLTQKEIEKLKTNTIIVVADIPIRTSIINLKSLNLTNLFVATKLLKNKFKDNYSVQQYLYAIKVYNSNNKLNIQKLDVVITEKCSLKCKECSNLINLYSKPKEYKIEKILKPLYCLLDKLDYVFELNILGGEPFLFKQLDFLLQDIISKYNNFNKIVVWTNGTIIPNNKIINVLKNNKILLNISDYKVVSNKVNKLIQVCKENSINYNVITHNKWQKCNDFSIRKRDDIQNQNIFDKCCVNDVYTLLKDSLYRCPFNAHVINLDMIKQNNIDNIKIDDMLSKKNLKLFISNNKFLECCKYCSGRSEQNKMVNVAEQEKIK